MSDYWSMMTGSKKGKAYFTTNRSKEKEQSPHQPGPGKVLKPEIIGSIRPQIEQTMSAQLRSRDPDPMIDVMRGIAPSMTDRVDGMSQRLQEASETGETFVEMREVVARSGGRIQARSMEVTLTFGQELDLGGLLQGALAIFDYTRQRAREMRGIPRLRPAPAYPAEVPLRFLPPPGSR